MSKTKSKRDHKKRRDKKHKTHKRHKEKKSKKRKSEKVTKIVDEATPVEIQISETNSHSYDIPIVFRSNVHPSHAPETPAEFQKRQSLIRRITDPETGRSRLIKGDGEVLEEIVSRDRHNQINKLSTESDGRFFQEKTVGKK